MFKSDELYTINHQNGDKSDDEEDPMKEVANFLEDIRPAIEEIMFEGDMSHKQFVYNLSDHIHVNTVEFYRTLFETVSFSVFNTVLHVLTFDIVHYAVK